MFTNSEHNDFPETDTSADGGCNPGNVAEWKNGVGESAILMSSPKALCNVSNRDQLALAIAKLRQAEIEEEVVYELRRLELERRVSRARREAEFLRLHSLMRKKSEETCHDVAVRNNGTSHRPNVEFPNGLISLTADPSASDILGRLDLPQLDLPSFTGGHIDHELGGSKCSNDISSQSVEPLSEELHDSECLDVADGVAHSLEGEADKAEHFNPVTTVEGHSGVGPLCRKPNRRLNNSRVPTTRSGVFLYVSRYYDLLDLVAPIILPAKTLLREFCRRNLGWDDKISEDDLKRWRDLLEGLLSLYDSRIARCVTPGDAFDAILPELYMLSDAPETGCGFACYARVQVAKKSILWGLVWYRLRVASLKPIRIPRLELTIAYLPSLQYRLK